MATLLRWQMLSRCKSGCLGILAANDKCSKPFFVLVYCSVQPGPAQRGKGLCDLLFLALAQRKVAKKTQGLYKIYLKCSLRPGKIKNVDHAKKRGASAPHFLTAIFIMPVL